MFGTVGRFEQQGLGERSRVVFAAPQRLAQRPRGGAQHHVAGDLHDGGAHRHALLDRALSLDANEAFDGVDERCDLLDEDARARTGVLEQLPQNDACDGLLARDEVDVRWTVAS
jgi:hypothetical protein